LLLLLWLLLLRRLLLTVRMQLLRRPKEVPVKLSLLFFAGIKSVVVWFPVYMPTAAGVRKSFKPVEICGFRFRRGWCVLIHFVRVSLGNENIKTMCVLCEHVVLYQKIVKGREMSVSIVYAPLMLSYNVARAFDYR
jgi:hypothetical protein